jgi:SNF2 family DNA or RNA helicase
MVEGMKAGRVGMFSSRSENQLERVSEDIAIVEKSYSPDGVIFKSPHYNQMDWLREPLAFARQQSMLSFLGQVEEEGYANWGEGRVVLSWASVYQLMESDDYRSGLSLLEMPPVLPWRPQLESQGGLGDSDFAILVAGWLEPSGQPIPGDLNLMGPLVTWKGQDSLLSQKTWLTLQSISEFYQRPPAERAADSNRRGWAKIRRYALAANADLSHFLRSTVVLTPDKLQLNLRKAEGSGTKLVEVIPGFEGAPSNWLDVFDRATRVPQRYDIPNNEGIIQVILSPEIQTVLGEIKRMPGRRVVGTRAEAFVRNPFATLGPDAAMVIDPDEFEKNREDAGIFFARFTPGIVRDESGVLIDVALNIEEAVRGELRTRQVRFGARGELEKFVATLAERISQSAQYCVWEGEELEILGDTSDHLEILRRALVEWQPERFSLADIMDLSFYSERVQGVGIEKPYFSPFIARKEHKSEWFSEDVSYGITYDPQNGSDPIPLALDETTINEFENQLEKAKKEGAKSFSFQAFPRPVAVAEAERIAGSFRAAGHDIRNKTLDIEKLKPINQARFRNQLIVKSNIDLIDYVERRGALSLPEGTEPKLPSTLKPEFPLKPHQRDGLKWLQHLWSLSPHNCRGALLADDMGLGKTIQLLAFVARCLEENPQADPFLIVAPVSLLENWKEEITKFFEADTLPVLALYGPALALRRVPRQTFDAEIIDAGIDSLLVRNWVGKAKIVLTTYETLRDLEFSLCRQKWSAMICDEAQKIKNPNAMVSRAAKKQNARFKIACTGTPVENTLTDLWCLFDFLQPGLLGALASFGHKYKRPIEAKTTKDKARIEELRALIEPQKLRRMKTEVAKELPPKIEPAECRNLAISPFQRVLYAKAVQEFRVRNSLGKGARMEDHLRLLHYLRTLCTDPRSSRDSSDDYESIPELERQSPKLAWLLSELPKIRARQEKVIVFCEFRNLQRTLKRAIGERLGLVPDIINGDTSAAAENANNRQRRIQAFQDKPGFNAIILSPLAVGFGLNIQGANHVIHFSRTWNPAKEDQATDRVYRIGQKRDVYVYYPVVTAADFQTFDAKLDQLLEWKRDLSHDMLNGSGEVSSSDFGSLQEVEGGDISLFDLRESRVQI